MIFVNSGRVYLPDALNGDSVESSSFSSSNLDYGFYAPGVGLAKSISIDLAKANPHSINFANPASNRGASLNVGEFFVNRGLTVVIGEPGSGKSFFVKEGPDSLTSKGFSLLEWGEPGAGMENQHLGRLLRHMNQALAFPNRSAVIDSVMPLIISEDSNLGQGGLSKRVLTYLRQLATIYWAMNGHLVLVMNPLEGGNILYLWVNYLRAVCHSVVLIDNRKVFISSRIEDTVHGVVPPNRVLASADGMMRSLVQSMNNGFQVINEAMNSLSRSTNGIPSHKEVYDPAVTSDPTFGAFPRIR